MGRPIRDLTGQRFGHLTVLRRGPDREQPSGYRAIRWWTRCDCGAEVLVRRAGLVRARPDAHMGCPLSARRVDSPGYIVAHQRISRERGKASEHVCADCDNRAEDWAWLGCDDVRDDVVNGRTLSYCLHPATCYTPLCRRCHVAHDRQPMVVL